MHTRIVGRQQAVSLELGRLRMGTYEGNRPVASKTWIFTSPFREYLDHAAALRNGNGTPVYGGTVESWQPQGKGTKEWRLITAVATIEAVLGPGDPVSQANEMWSAGGCQRRCDGETAEVRERADDGLPDRRVAQDCVCLAQFGPEFHRQKDGTVCKTHTRIKILMEDLLGVGFWRVETTGFFASGRVPGLIDLVKAVVGPTVLLPVRLTIVPRTKVADGRTSRYTELVAQIPGFTFGQLRRGELDGLTELDPVGERAAITGAQRALPAGPTREQPSTAAQTGDQNHKPAPVSAGQTRSPAPAPERRGTEPTSPARPPAAGGDTGSLEKAIAEATTVEALRPIWNDVAKTKDDGLKTAWWARKRAIESGDTAPAEPAAVVANEPAAEVAEAEPDRKAMWTQALALADTLGWDTAKTSQRFREEIGKDVANADGWDLEIFVSALRIGKIG
jgi:hypothetical protein